MKNKTRLISIIVIIIFIVSCSSSGHFGITQRYYLNKNETERPLDKFVVEKYEKIINIDTLNIPLNKYITSKNYKVYIGIAFTTNTKELYNFYQNDTSYLFIKKIISSNTANVFFKKHNEFYYSLFYNSNKDKFTYVLTLESDSAFVEQCFQGNFLLNKISNAN